MIRCIKDGRYIRSLLTVRRWSIEQHVFAGAKGGEQHNSIFDLNLGDGFVFLARLFFL